MGKESTVQRASKQADDALKAAVHHYWNAQSCGTGVADAEKFTRKYFDEIEEERYRMEPQIFSFAQFSRFRDKKVLEMGVGAGTDFLQWVRSGAKAFGIDLTEEAIEHVERRLALYGLEAEEVRVADVENLPFADQSFDLVYSWGVIHHTPNTEKALGEAVRVMRVGARMKFMIYNRHSLHTFYRWVRYALLCAKPFKSLRWVLYHHMESLGTKGFTLKEVHDLLARHPLHVIDVSAQVNRYDLLWNRPWPLRVFARGLACLLGHHRCGFFLTFEAEKTAELKKEEA